jgi:hypothetical protein
MARRRDIAKVDNRSHVHKVASNQLLAVMVMAQSSYGNSVHLDGLNEMNENIDRPRCQPLEMGPPG